jgi:hypothetical protein
VVIVSFDVKIFNLMHSLFWSSQFGALKASHTWITHLSLKTGEVSCYYFIGYVICAFSFYLFVCLVIIWDFSILLSFKSFIEELFSLGLHAAFCHIICVLMLVFTQLRPTFCLEVLFSIVVGCGGFPGHWTRGCDSVVKHCLVCSSHCIQAPTPLSERKFRDWRNHSW